jgi:glutathione S-transferase
VLPQFPYFLQPKQRRLQHLSRRGGYYGETDAIADFAKTSVQAAFQTTTEATVESLRRQFGKFGSVFESRLAETGTGFCAGARLTFADVVLAQALTEYLEWVPDLLVGTPLLTALHVQVLDLPGIGAALSNGRRYLCDPRRQRLATRLAGTFSRPKQVFTRAITRDRTGTPTHPVTMMTDTTRSMKQSLP